MSTLSQQKHTRRPSWPTLQILTPSTMSKGKSPTSTPPSEDIDEDPFSHFLSPVRDEDDPFDGSEYNAGIDTFDQDVENKRTKFRARLEEKWGNFISRRSASPQKDGHRPPRTPPSEDQLPDLVLDDLEGFGSPSSSPPNLPTLPEMDEEVDGWEADRRRLRRKTNFNLKEKPLPRPKLERPKFKRFRTLSGRPHSFIEPSPHLWTVDEHDETHDTVILDIRARRWSRS